MTDLASATAQADRYHQAFTEGTGEPDPRPHLCVLCERRVYERAQVCNPCRRWLLADLGQLARLWLLLPAAVAPANGVEGGLPIRVNVVDLTLPNGATDTIHDDHGDQTGEIPVRARLDSWVDSWTAHRAKGERQPIPTVPVLTSWLIARLDDACDTHPAIVDFAREIRLLAATIRRALNLEPPPVIRFGAPCPRCGTKTLRRLLGGEWIECQDCGRLWGDDDYAELVRDTMPGNTMLSAAQLATIQGVTRDAVYKRVRRGQLNPDIGPWGGMYFVKADVLS